MRKCSLLVALLAAALVAGACTDAPEATTERQTVRDETPPNVLIILTDDQPVDSLTVMPETRKWFRRRGTDFPSAFVTTPYCCPSRASISTGLYTHNHGIRRGLRMRGNADLDHTLTVEYQLRNQAGYRTAFFGKYLNGWDLSQDPPHLDTWAVFPNSSPHGYYGAEWNVDGRREVVETYSTEFIRRRGVRFIRGNADRPWLMYLSTAAPHPPYQAEPRYENAEVGGWRAFRRNNDAVGKVDVSDKHPMVAQRSRGLRPARRKRREQLRTLMSVDDLVGSVMQTLGETGQRRNTLAFFLSDNGYLWGEYGLTGKLLPYTRSVQVPLFMRWPQGRVAEGVKDRRLVANIDLAATIYDAAGIEDAPRTDGRSLLDDGWDRDRLHFDFYEAHGRPTWASTRTRDHLYIEWYEDDEGTRLSFREYYDLRNDPFLLDNLFARPRAARDLDGPGLAAQLAADRECRADTCP
jgi:arylsulfatase A-like enzyme